MSIFYLRKGFKVCGMLEDVYVARKRNKFGEPYGFVKFSNVRDVDKMTKALNAVWFGQFRVRASVAKFDRYAPGVERRVEEEQTSFPKGIIGKQHGHQPPTRHVSVQGEDYRTNSAEVSIETPDPEKDGPRVQVGDIVLNLANRKRQAARIEGVQQEKKQMPKISVVPVDAVKGKEDSILLRNVIP
jgi:hypothetical protein